MNAMIARFLSDETGSTAIEYALIGTIVGIGIIGSLTSLQAGLNAHMADVVANLS